MVSGCIQFQTQWPCHFNAETSKVRWHFLSFWRLSFQGRAWHPWRHLRIQNWECSCFWNLSDIFWVRAAPNQHRHHPPHAIHGAKMKIKRGGRWLARTHLWARMGRVHFGCLFALSWVVPRTPLESWNRNRPFGKGLSLPLLWTWDMDQNVRPTVTFSQTRQRRHLNSSAKCWSSRPSGTARRRSAKALRRSTTETKPAPYGTREGQHRAHWTNDEHRLTLEQRSFGLMNCNFKRNKGIFYVLVKYCFVHAYHASWSHKQGCFCQIKWWHQKSKFWISRCSAHNFVV